MHPYSPRALRLVAEIISAVVAESGVDCADIVGGSRDAETIEARRVVVRRLTLRGFPLEGIAALFRMSSVQSVRRVYGCAIRDAGRERE